MPGSQPAAVTATEIADVQRIYVAESDCAAVLRQNLAGHGFHISSNGPVDAVVSLNLSQQRPLRKSLPVIESFGAQAKYTAQLTGADNELLLSLYGQEGSLSFRELCDDIGDEIAAKLGSYLPQK